MTSFASHWKVSVKDRDSRVLILVNVIQNLSTALIIYFNGVGLVCQLDKDPGGCRAAIPKWFFNSGSGKCETFNYGGCDGNANNFETEQECKDKCNSSGKEQATVQCTWV